MNEASGAPRDSSGVTVRPPIAWALTAIAGLALDWLYPLPFLPAPSAGWLGGIVFLAGLALLIWAATTFRRAGTNVPTSQPTTAIVEEGPYRHSHNPIYIGMFLGLIGLAVGFDSLWLLVLLVPFFLVIRYTVVAREEPISSASSATSIAATRPASAVGCKIGGCWSRARRRRDAAPLRPARDDLTEVGRDFSANVKALDQAVLYAKNVAAHRVEQHVALEIAGGQVDLDLGRSVRADREAERLRVGVHRCPLSRPVVADAGASVDMPALQAVGPDDVPDAWSPAPLPCRGH